MNDSKKCKDAACPDHEQCARFTALNTEQKTAAVTFWTDGDCCGKFAPKPKSKE